MNGVYVRQPGNPVWMPEIGLGIGCQQGVHEDWNREWLYWYDSEGNRFPAPANLIEQERQRANRAEQELEQERQRTNQAQQQLEQERQRAEQERLLREELLNRLRERGINLDDL